MIRPDHGLRSFWRAVAGAIFRVVASGIFQPSSVLPEALAHDFDLWRNIMREYSEELLATGRLAQAGAAASQLAQTHHNWLMSPNRRHELLFCLG